MKLSLTVIALVMQATFAGAQETITCTGQLDGVNWQSAGGPFPVKVTLTKQDSQGYILNYVGPAYSLSNNPQGFTYALRNDQVKKLAFTTGSQVSIEVLGNDNYTHFSLELDSNKISKEVIASVNYADGKSISISGELNCVTKQ